MDKATPKAQEVATEAMLKVRKKVHQLRDDLEWLRALLRHADQRRRQEINEYMYIELWVPHARDVALDAEDLLEEYSQKEKLKCHCILDLLPSFVRWLWRPFIRHSISNQIDNIKERIDEIKKTRKGYELKILPETWAHPEKYYIDWSDLNEENIEDPDKLVGIKEKMEQIATWLTCREKPLQTVIAIIGENGVGKTTLASCIYQTRSVRTQFDCNIWIHLPQKFRVVDILIDIILQTITSVDMTEAKKNLRGKDEEALMQELAEKLSKKKYLIVLDDVRRLEELKFFLAVLPAQKENEESAILITAQIKSPNPPAANSSGQLEYMTGRIHKKEVTSAAWLQLCHHYVELKKLEKGQGREMFCRRLFGESDFPSGFRKMHVHSKALESLLDQSLPLAVTLLAGLLRTKKEDEWTDVVDLLLQYSKHNNNGDDKIEKEEATKPNLEDEGNRESKQQEQEKEEEIMEQLQIGEGQHQGEQHQREAGQQGEQQQVEQQAETQNQIKPVGGLFRNQPLIKKILILSFDDLPSYLKQCLLYFAAFKAEEDIDAEKIIRLWVAEGLVQATDGHTMEEHAEDCLKMLISRCLINLVQVGYNNKIITVSIHESVLDFAMSEARDSNFLQVHHSTTDLPRAAIRRLSLQNAFDTHTRLNLSTPKLRSLLCEFPEAPSDDHRKNITNCYSHSIQQVRMVITGRINNDLNICRCTFLRVIDLKGTVQEFTLPEEIGWLVHLRYLGLADSRLRGLPSSVKKLRSLQTLDITNTDVDSVPQEFWNLKALRHVLARHLKKGPRQVHSLNNLQTLHGVPWGRWVHEKKRLTNLRSLQVWNLSTSKRCKALLTYLASLECLTSLDLEVKEGAQIQLDRLLIMPVLRNLGSLKIHGPVQATEQSYSYLLPNLSKLELCGSGLNQNHIDMIAGLPNLLELILGKDSYMHQDMSIPPNGFRELRKLRFNGLPELVKWHVQSSADGVLSSLSHLEHLCIFSCAKLELIPDYLLKLENLVQLTFHDLPKLLMLPSLGKFSSKNPTLVLGE
ncbi:hypothetical protein PVAP13_8KG322400 [Panicum virgatum]|uniref:Uncharacterized protein n=1 Tax=Panicum virgatum TaxID=38727 RepID=A0A8T0PM33_PANVG|nr:hypothetical protein PVAP13_8KG322400 [Panicum virgatum]